ncbi:hypothetical protein RRG08_017192 [Elysia crispata]|uniref:Vitellogenin n=1 Tax=Elysia crispata TaxID=231223 RepID=A0AAE1CN34_9GAST|nr:hypothetical protein RRG08_017192 [Elysia crispata]
MHSDACFTSLFVLSFFMHTCIRCAILAGDAEIRNENIEGDKSVEYFYYSKHLGLTLPSFDQKLCRIQVGATDDQIIDLSPLARRDGKPRFKAKFNVTPVVVEDLKLPSIEMNYAFNPCVPYTFEADKTEEPLGSKNLCKDVTSYVRCPTINMLQLAITICSYRCAINTRHLKQCNYQIPVQNTTAAGASPP